MFHNFADSKIFLAVAVGLVVMMTGCTSTSAASSPDEMLDINLSAKPVQCEEAAAEDVVRLFYEGYLDYARFDPAQGTRNNPLVDGTYRDSPYLSPHFIQNIDAALAGGKIRFDPFLCAQDVPTDLEIVKRMSMSPETVHVTIKSGLGNLFEVGLEWRDETWQIVDVNCTPEL